MLSETFDPIPDKAFPEFVDRVYAAVLSYGGSTSLGLDTNRSDLCITMGGRLNGDHFRLSVTYDRVLGAPVVEAVANLGEELFREIVDKTRLATKRWFVAHAQVRLDLGGSLREHHILGPYWLAPREEVEQVKIETELRHFAAGGVRRHVLAVRVAAVDEAQARRLGDVMLVDGTALFSFLLDHPVVPLERAQVWGPPSDGDEAEALEERLRRLGCPLAPTGEGHPAPLWDARDLWPRLNALSEDDQERALIRMRSYRRALCLSKPHTGAEPYQDRSLALVMWSSIVEGMADPSIKKSARRVRSLLDSTWLGATWEEFNTRVRSVRHVVAHEGHLVALGRDHAGRHISDVDAVLKGQADDRACELGQRVARKAILHFLERGGWPRPEPAPDERGRKRSPLPKRHLHKLQEASDLAGRMRDAVKATGKGESMSGEVRFGAHRVADLLQGVIERLKAEEDEEEPG